jgi:hypothetical protein
MNKNDDKKKGKTLSDKDTRRTFLKNMGYASLGAAIALGNGDKVLARLLRSATTTHVDEFLSIASSAEFDEETLNALEASSHYLLKLCNTDSNAKNTFDALKIALFHESGIDVPPGQGYTILGLPLKKSDAAAASFLWSVKTLRTGIPTKLEIAEAMENPRNILDFIEQDFVKTMANRVSSEWRENHDLSAKLDGSTSRLANFTSKFIDDNPGGGGGGGPTYNLNCYTPDGVPISDAACIFYIIIMIVIIIIAVIQIIKKKKRR